MQQLRPALVRMYILNEQLRRSTYPNCSSLARRCDVHPKTILRDIDYLRLRFGAPIEYDKSRKGYYYHKEWSLFPSIILEKHEAEALQATRKVLSQYKGTPYYEEISRALDKLLQYLPQPFAEEGQFSFYSFEQPSGTLEFSSSFVSLEAAIRQGKKVHIDYEAHSTAAVTERVIHPLRLHYSHRNQTWYLVAYCELRKDIRTFVVGRIRKLKLLEEHFDFPPDFSVDDYLSKTFDQVVGETEQEVSIRFSAYQAPWIKERQWHPTQQIEEHGDGRITIRFQVSGLDAIKRWVMRYGKEAEVLEPQELRDMVRKEVRDMGEVYG